jgi:hypothetical protein
VIPSGIVSDRLQRAFTPTQRGVVGLTEQLLGACVGGDVEFERVGDRCVYRWTEGGDTREAPVPFSPAAFRTILARVAALCNARSPGSVSPYGGEGELVVGAAEVFVKFINTAHAQKLEVKNDPGSNMVPQSLPAKEDAAVAEWKPPEVSQPVDTPKYDLSDSELQILGSLLDELLRGGRALLLTEDLTGPVDESTIDPEAYTKALEMAIGVRPRHLNVPVVRRFMGAVILHWIRLKVSLGLIAIDDMGIAIHHAAAQFANAYPFGGEGSGPGPKDAEKEPA